MALLDIDGLLAGYKGLTVVRGIDIAVEPGEIVALLGANGAGKSTTLLTVSGLAEQHGGSIEFDGHDLQPLSAAARTRSGIGHVTEDRALFQKLTVRENIRLGGHGDTSALGDVLTLMPALEPLLDRTAGSLSGGEQQMLALARSLAAKPRLLMVDELSLGLAPLIVKRLLGDLRQLADDGLGILVVEQHVEQVLRVADRVVVLARGRISFEGVPSDLAGRRDRLAAAYLGAGRDDGRDDGRGAGRGDGRGDGHSDVRGGDPDNDRVGETSAQ